MHSAIKRPDEFRTHKRTDYFELPVETDNETLKKLKTRIASIQIIGIG